MNGEDSMKKPIIGISANETEDSGAKLHHLPIHYLPAGYVRGIQQAGGLPILLPVGTKEDAVNYISQIDKLVLTGGQNVDPKHYGEKPIFDESLMLSSRDEFEMALIEEALHESKPIFAVCRGLQLVNVYFGGSLYQDLSQRDIEEVKHMQDPIPREVPTHGVKMLKGSHLHEIYGEIYQVNSFHFQGVSELGKGLKATAFSEDGIIEGIESVDLPSKIIGVQWHPDFYFELFKEEQNMFRYVVEQL